MSVYPLALGVVQPIASSRSAPRNQVPSLRWSISFILAHTCNEEFRRILIHCLLWRLRSHRCCDDGLPNLHRHDPKHSSCYVTEDKHEEEDGSDDNDSDVPLVQYIPGTLTAQKTIRWQFRKEREQRKLEKALWMENDNGLRHTVISLSLWTIRNLLVRPFRDLCDT